jgi:hypothetical protein
MKIFSNILNIVVSILAGIGLAYIYNTEYATNKVRASADRKKDSIMHLYRDIHTEDSIHIHRLNDVIKTEDLIIKRLKRKKP